MLSALRFSASRLEQTFRRRITRKGFELVARLAPGGGFASLEGSVRREQYAHVVVGVITPPDAHAC